MKILADPSRILTTGLAAIRAQYKVPSDFPADVLAAAQTAATRAPTQHVDRTAWDFVTLDPASATDLDQAFYLEQGAGGTIMLHYAIADVPWFVDDDGPIDREAWRRGTTQYLPDGKAALYPPVLAEGAASLLPDGPRPAILLSVALDEAGEPSLQDVGRIILQSRGKLAYDAVRDDELSPLLPEFAARMAAAELARGASRVDPPEQEVHRLADGGYALTFRPQLPSEINNAALSLAANIAVGKALFAHHTGLFRTMAEPDDKAVGEMRHIAAATGLVWPDAMPLAQFERTLDPGKPRDASFMMAIRRAGEGARYEPYQDGERPWHAAVAATYAHATAPLRRLADRYVLRAALAVAHGAPVPDRVTQAFSDLPRVMASADSRAGQIDRAVNDLAEAVLLAGQAGKHFAAMVTDVDERGARIQFCDVPVLGRVDASGLAPGDPLTVRLDAVDVERRHIALSRVIL